MTAAMARYGSASEARVLDELRPRYERRGYRFVVHPPRSTLPAFMAGYIPDAVAMNDHENIAIEVKGSPSTGLTDNLERIRGLFVGRSDWKFTVVYGGNEAQASVSIPFADAAAIEKEVDGVERVLSNGGTNAALLMGFALLEASLQSLSRTGDQRPRRPDTVVQTLAMNGSIAADDEIRLRALADLRNKIVHGDLTQRVDSDDVRWMLLTIRRMLNSNN